MKHNLNDIKQDYQNIKIPENLKKQVEVSIQQAKADNEKETASRPGTDKKHASKFLFYLTRGIGGVAAAVFALAVLTNSSASIAHAMEQIPVLGAIVKVVTFREYKHSENQMEADIKIPEVQVADSDGETLEDATKTMNDNIQAYTDEIIAAYEADVKASGGEGTEAVNLDYEVVTDNDKLFSLRFQQTTVMAGANQSEKIYHIDKTTGKMITLKDLFQDGADYKTPVSENIKEQMRAQMAQDEMKTYWLDSDMPEWDFQEISDTVNFYVNESGKLVIVFDEYEVAPGYMGIVTFEIPTEAVKDIIKDGYLN